MLLHYSEGDDALTPMLCRAVLCKHESCFERLQTRSASGGFAPALCPRTSDAIRDCGRNLELADVIRALPRVSALLRGSCGVPRSACGQRLQALKGPILRLLNANLL